MSALFNLKYRPKSFQEFIGNETAIQGLLQSYPDWPSTFLLIGQPGIGKTSLARLIAKQVKCDESNIKEINAGQDRGIDNIRNLTHGALQRPIIGNSKVYIFDECQGLTKEAQEALLKITEEAPKNTYFIFCSTDPNKIIKALKARCQAGFINLEPMTNKNLGKLIKHICDEEKIDFNTTVQEIATECIYHAEGVPRNAVMTFQKYYQYKNVDEVKKFLKSMEETVPEEMWPFINALESKSLKSAIEAYQALSIEEKFVHAKLSVLIANVFKKKLLNEMIGTGTNVSYYTSILTFFGTPLDSDIFGEIEFIRRLGLLHNEIYAG